MKMVKSLLLGTAAGFVAIAGAQAADLPVKAKPVQYVKICSLYGAGFYYIPGTDMCLKIGGWVRLEIGQNYNGSLTTGPMAGALNDRTTNDEVWRSRGYITADARNQTEYGTLRSYIAVGLNANDVANGDVAFNANRAFIQWAGFTAGLATSFYDFYSSPSTAYFGSYPGSDTGDGGWKVLAYTAQFGNGFSGTISAEVARRTAVYNAQSGGFATFGTLGANVYKGFDMPDVVANLRVDQPWGSAQIMGALHRVGGTYYSNNAVNGNPDFVGAAAGHPDNKLGFAVGAGIKLLNPTWGPGDYFQGMISYTQGASRYNFMNPNFNAGIRHSDGQGFGFISDAVFGGRLQDGNTTSLELTETLAINAAYEHFWNPAWRTSVYGGYAEVNYSGLASAMMCNNLFGGTGQGSSAVAKSGCDNDWSVWWLGTRTQWNVTKDFYMGLDVLYQKLNTASTPGNVGVFTLSGIGFPKYGNSDQDNLGFRFRVHRDFYP